MSRDVDWPFLPFQWLNEEKIIQRLVELIHPSQDEDVSVMLTVLTFCHESPHDWTAEALAAAF
jgi:glutamate/tyrosine decarboxylase-like PLP-dependent enzyme